MKRAGLPHFKVAVFIQQKYANFQVPRQNDETRVVGAEQDEGGGCDKERFLALPGQRRRANLRTAGVANRVCANKHKLAHTETNCI